MNPAPAPKVSAAAAGFRDGFGERALIVDRSSGESLEILRLRPELTAAPSFEFALRERTARLANFRHTAYGRVRRVDRRPEAGGLVVVSEHVEGIRLAEILRVTERDGLGLNINAALCLIRQLVPAVALLHENARDVAHGAVAPERLVVTRHARVVVVEHVLGAAVEQLQYGRERFWRELRVAMPAAAGMLRCDQRTDVTQMGVVALALILGRVLRDEEFPHQIPELLREATELSVLGDRQPLSDPLQQWLQRTLQLDLRRSFATAREAHQALEQILSDEQGYVAAPVALETFLAAYQAGERGLPVGMAERDQTTGASRQSTVTSLQSSFGSQPSTVDRRLTTDDSKATPAAPRTPARPPEPVAHVAPPVPVQAPSAAPAQTPTVRTVAPVRDAQPTDSLRRVSADNAAQPTTHTPGVNVRPKVASADVVSDVSAQPEAGEPDIVEPEVVEPEDAQPVARPRGHRWRRIAIVILTLVAFGEGAIIAARSFWNSAPAPVRLGTLVVESSPSGVEIFIDGLARGRTPARLSLAAGAHILEVRGRGLPRVIPLTMDSGAQLSQYLELSEAPVNGSLEIQSEPAGARVSVDGEPRGVTPLTLTNVKPGEHAVVLDASSGPVHQKVTVQAGATASIVVPLMAAPSGPVSGWVAVSAPFEMDIFEDSRLIGTTQSDRIMVSAGRHVFDMVNDTLGYRGTHTVNVVPGKVATLQIDLPKGTLHLNATPWAEVWIDGQRQGETPLGNLAVPIGAHEVVFKHPQHGEKRVAITVTLAEPARLSVDMGSR